MENYSRRYLPPSMQTSVLRFQPNCERCRMKVKKAIGEAHGVHAISVDANEGKVEVTSTVDPQKLMDVAQNVGKRAELIWEPRLKPKHECSRRHAVAPIATSSQVYHYDCLGNFDHFDRSLQDFISNNRKIKHVELVHQRSVKMTFKDSDDGGGGCRASPVRSVIVEEFGNNQGNSLSHDHPPSPPSSACSLCNGECRGCAAAVAGQQPHPAPMPQQVQQPHPAPMPQQVQQPHPEPMPQQVQQPQPAPMPQQLQQQPPAPMQMQQQVEQPQPMPRHRHVQQPETMRAPVADLRCDERLRSNCVVM